MHVAARLARIARRATTITALSAILLGVGALPAADAGSVQDSELPHIGGGGATPVPESPRQTSKQAADARLLQLHNDERARHGLRTLTVDASLTSFARRRANEMAAKEDVWHSRSLPAGERWYVVGENVGRAPTVEEVFERFLSSHSHRANVFRAGFRAAGIGVATKAGTEYVAVVYGQPWPPRPPATVAFARFAPSQPPAAGTKPAAIRPAPPSESQSVTYLVRLVALEQ